MQLRNYQAKILEELRHLPAIALFMGTGTGKTITSLFRFKENPTDKLLVVCPKKVVTQWEDVIASFDSNLNIVPLEELSNAKKKNQRIENLQKSDDVIVVNFEIMSKLSSLKCVIDENWTIIIDESHKIKESGTKRSPVKVTKAVLELKDLTEYKILLTATPTQKKLGGYIDYFTQLKFLGYMNMELEDFKYQYCKEQAIVLPGRPYPIKQIVAYRNTWEIENILQNVARRYVPKYGDFEPQHTKIRIERTKKYTKTELNMTYEDIMLDNVSRKRIGLKTLTSGVIMGYDTFKEKLYYEDNNHKISWVQEFLEDTDECITVFYQYDVELEILKKLLTKMKKKFIVINGKTKDKYRELQKDFDVVLGQYQAMAESLDGLQHKSHITVFYSLPESSLLYKQALGRTDRVGQTKAPMYYYLVMEKTIDEQIYKLIENKVEFNEEILNKLLIEEEK